MNTHKLPFLFESYARSVKNSQSSCLKLKKTFRPSPRHFRFSEIDILLSALKNDLPKHYTHWTQYPTLKGVKLYDRVQLLYFKKNRHQVRWLWSLKNMRI